MTSDDDKRDSSDRRQSDRRVADDPDYKGPERRQGDRRSGKDPWCIIGWLKFQKVMAHFEGRLAFRVQWPPFELNPHMPPEGEDAFEHVIRKYGITQEQSRANSGRLAAIAADLGFAFNRGPGFRMRNSFDAHRLLTWAGALEEPDQAAATGVQTALKLALFRAHFTDNRDVGDPAVLIDVAASVGLDAARAAAILDGDDYAEMVRMEEAYWADNNVTGVPAFPRRPGVFDPSPP